MDEAQVELVKTQALTINFPSISAPVTVRTDGDEIVILMRLTLRPRDNVMNIDFDVSTGGDGATVSSFDKNATSDVRRYWRTRLPV